MSYHRDKDVNRALIELLDALCTFERNSGRGSTLLLIPHNPDEGLLIALDGKPLKKLTAAEALNSYMLAFQHRKEKLMGEEKHALRERT